MERLISHICGEVGILKSDMIDVVKIVKRQNSALRLASVGFIIISMYMYLNEKEKAELKKEVEELKGSKGE